jgi:cation diffusion facilitator CzcD-associated flavoprotein CzcO
MSEKVCIIGAGSSGIVAAKTLKETLRFSASLR